MIPGGTRVQLNPWLPVGDVAIIDGVVHARGFFDISARWKLEQRRLDAVAAFAPELLHGG